MKQYKLPLTVNEGRRKRAAPYSFNICKIAKTEVFSIITMLAIKRQAQDLVDYLF